MVRELQPLAVTLDHLLGGRLPQATLLQRYKACEMFLWDGNWVTARHLEIIPPSMASLVRSEEREMAARQELKAVGEPVQSRKRLGVRQRVRPTLGETCEPSEKKNPDRHLEWPLWATAWKSAAPVAWCDWGHGRSDIYNARSTRMIRANGVSERSVGCTSPWAAGVYMPCSLLGWLVLANKALA